MNGLALKVTFNDGGAAWAGALGFDGPCFDATMRANVAGTRRGRWCSTEGNPCHAYVGRGCQGPRPVGEVCNESRLFRSHPWLFGGGGYHSGPKVGEWMPIRRASKGDLIVLTTVPPGMAASERVIFGCYRLGEPLTEPHPELGYYLQSDGTLEVKLNDDEATALPFWRFYTNQDGSKLWGSGLHRYLSEGQTAAILGAMARQMGERPERGRILEVLADRACWNQP